MRRMEYIDHPMICQGPLNPTMRSNQEVQKPLNMRKLTSSLPIKIWSKVKESNTSEPPANSQHQIPSRSPWRQRATRTLPNPYSIHQQHNSSFVHLNAKIANQASFAGTFLPKTGAQATLVETTKLKDGMGTGTACGKEIMHGTDHIGLIIHLLVQFDLPERIEKEVHRKRSEELAGEKGLSIGKPKLDRPNYLEVI